MSEEKPGYLGQILGVLYRPRQIFSTIDETDTVKGLLVMFLMVLLASYSSMVYMSKIPLTVLSPQLEGVDVSQIEGSMGLFAGIGTGITILVGWTASTLLMHGLGRLMGGDGAMRRMFALHGFASVPSLLHQLLRVVDASIIDQTALTGYFLSNREINKAILALMGTNLLNIWGISTVLLLIISVRDNYGQSRTKATIVVLAPSLVYFLINYFTG